MSQQVVEAVIGRLACDEEYRRRFAQERSRLVRELVGRGLPLTPVECRALVETDYRACEDFAARLDPRIQKADLRKSCSSGSPARTSGGEAAALLRLRDVVAFLDARPDNTGVVELAASLAEQHSADMTGVLLVPDLLLDAHEMFAVGDAIPSLLADQEVRRREMETARRHLVERVAGRHGIAAKWASVPGFTNYDATTHARAADVAVIARPEPAGNHWGDRRLLIALILTSGRPLIVLPPRAQASGIRRVLVAWNGKREAARAIADALPLLVKAEAVRVLAVDVQGRREESRRQDSGADIARHLERRGANVDARHVPSGGQDVGRVLLAEAHAFGADLVVMGAYGRSRLCEHLFGGVTRTVLREAELPVLMSH